MALQYSGVVRDARLDAIEATVGTSAVLKIRTGPPPATVDDIDSGTVLATLTLPSDWMAAASGGVKAKAGTWQDLEADNNGEAGHFRIYDSSGAVAHVQGTITETGESPAGDMVLSDKSISAGQSIIVNSFSITEGNP